MTEKEFLERGKRNRLRVVEVRYEPRHERQLRAVLPAGAWTFNGKLRWQLSKLAELNRLLDKELPFLGAITKRLDYVGYRPGIYDVIDDFLCEGDRIIVLKDFSRAFGHTLESHVKDGKWV